MAGAPLMLTGATGFIGQRLRLGLAGPWRVVTATRALEPGGVAVDLAKEDSIARAFHEVRPAAVVHAGGIADPETCEREPDLAHRVNVDAVRVLAHLCAATKTRLVHFSTDLVFKGEKGWYSEADTAGPLSIYGRTKLESEQSVLAICPESVVLRVSNCYGRLLGDRTCFLDHVWRSLAAGRPVPCFTDQWRTSTAADQLPAVVSLLLASRGLMGVFHWGGADRTSRYEAALTFCRVMGYDERLIDPVPAAQKRFLAPRPRDSSLNSSRLASALGLSPVGLEEGFAALRRSRA